MTYDHSIDIGTTKSAAVICDQNDNFTGYSWTRRLPPTALASAFIETTGAKNLEDLIQGYRPHDYEIGANAARTVFRVSELEMEAAVLVLSNEHGDNIKVVPA